jgi:hypothetical protein
MATFPSKVNYATGDILTATNMNDVGGAINLLDGAQYSGGKNRVLNSNFSIWQRGTSISLTASSGTVYVADRWCTSTNANQACTVSRQATGDTTNLPNIQYALRYQRNSGQTGTVGIYFLQNFETINSVPLAGKTVTMSFYARAGANFSAASSGLVYNLTQGTGTDQNAFGGYTGGSPAISGTATLTTNWQRFSATGSVSATTTELCPQFIFNPTGTAGTSDYFEVTGVQIEVANTASPYAPNCPTYATELAACQRYYWRWSAGSTNMQFGVALSTTLVYFTIRPPVTPRVNPTAIDYTALQIYNNNAASNYSGGTWALSQANPEGIILSYTHGSAVFTANSGANILNGSSGSAYLGLSQEL